ncbi:MAG TPA: hypothetical protein VFO95_17415 [Gemmatimonadales bacterium]|jgi:phytoene dehydrogenase-like protein|nr:hypothetical protein [Gemmatimonadales bacterium]
MRRFCAALLLLLGGGLGIPDLDAFLYHGLGHEQSPWTHHVEEAGQSCHPDWCAIGIASLRDPGLAPARPIRTVGAGEETRDIEAPNAAARYAFSWSPPHSRSPPVPGHT